MNWQIFRFQYGVSARRFFISRATFTSHYSTITQSSTAKLVKLKDNTSMNVYGYCEVLAIATNYQMLKYSMDRPRTFRFANVSRSTKALDGQKFTHPIIWQLMWNFSLALNVTTLNKDNSALLSVIPESMETDALNTDRSRKSEEFHNSDSTFCFLNFRPNNG